MASHKGWDRLYPVQSVALSGGSFRLAKGQLALIDLDAPANTMGLKIIDSLDGLSKSNKFQLRVGKHEIKNNRSQSSRDWSTQTFEIENIIGLRVDAPSSDFETDEFTLGWDGFNDDTAINLTDGDNEEISLSLCGEAIGMIGYQANEVEVKAYLEKPIDGTVMTNHEMVENAVKFYNEYKLMGDIPLSNYLDVVAINSENTALAGADKVFYNLTLEDGGDSNALAAVQAQYNAIVKKTNRTDVASTYTILADRGATVASGSFSVGAQYIILVAGDTDFTAIGAADSNVGTIFTATGVGTGTGTASSVDIADYSKNAAWQVKGCADCPPGYSEFADGWIYSIALEDDGSDSTATVEGISVNSEASSAVAVNVTDGVTTYTFINSEELTQVEKEAFVTANESAVIELVAKDVKSVCSPDNSVVSKWVAGSVCKVTQVEYKIILADDECGVNKLDALAANYPEMASLTADSSNNCQTQYSGTVTTNVICDECDDSFRALWLSEAPVDYENKPWTTTAKVYSETAKMGIKFKAKKVVLSGSEVYRDDMAYMATSPRLKVAGGYITNYSESFTEGSGNRFAVNVLKIATEPENWGGNLRELEDITKRYEEGVSRHEGNNYAKWALGEETLLGGTTPYVDYVLTLRLKHYAQSFAGRNEETFYYHFATPIGKHVEVENLLNTLALKAGVEPVQAYAKD